MSNHKIEVVPVVLKPHPNADTLSIVDVYGWECVVKTEQFIGASLGAYILPDSIVPTSRPEFAFLAAKAKDDGTYRIKGASLRGVKSQGLLVPAKPHWKLGQDVADELGITHYEPEIHNLAAGSDKLRTGGYSAKTPKVKGIPIPEYTDIENFRRHCKLFDEYMAEDRAEVVITEKIHGSNFRAVHDGKELHVGSHHTWKMGKKRKTPFLSWLLKSDFRKRVLGVIMGAGWVNRNMTFNFPTKDMYWSVAEDLGLEAKLKNFPNIVLYGEVYGAVQKGFPYDADADHLLKLRIFDVMKDGKYMDWDNAVAFCDLLDLPTVPEVYRGEWDKDKALALAEEMSSLAPESIREGVVVKTLHEKNVPRLGRVILKIISQRYLTLPD